MEGQYLAALHDIAILVYLIVTVTVVGIYFSCYPSFFVDGKFTSL